MHEKKFLLTIDWLPTDTLCNAFHELAPTAVEHSVLFKSFAAPTLFFSAQLKMHNRNIGCIAWNLVNLSLLIYLLNFLSLNCFVPCLVHWTTLDCLKIIVHTHTILPATFAYLIGHTCIKKRRKIPMNAKLLRTW